MADVACTMLNGRAMSGCFYGPFVSTYQPLNCPWEMYEWENQGPDTAQAPTVTVMRNNMSIDVLGTIEDLGSAPQTVDIYTVDCGGNPVAHMTTTEAFHHWRFTLTGVNAGETIYVNGNYNGQVMASGTCTTDTVTPAPQCSGMYDWSVCEGSGSGSDTVVPPGDDDTGCNAIGGAPGLIVALSLLVVRRRRRRRSP